MAPLCQLKQMHEDMLQHYDCTDQPAAAQPAPPFGAGGSAAENAGANPQPQPAGSQDNCHGKLVLPQLNRLHEAFKRNQVSRPASSRSQDQQPTRGPNPIPSQRRLTQQLTQHWPQFKALRLHYASTRSEDQRQLHLPQKHKATVPESSLRVEMNALEEQADNAKARDLYWKPLSWLGTIRPSSASDAFDPNLWATFVSPRRSVWRSLHSPLSLATITTRLLILLSVAAKNTAWTFTATTQLRAQLTQVQPRRMTG